jgi:hypothetical protein
MKQTTKGAEMTRTEERALRVSAMLLEAETLAIESKRLGEKFREECSHCYGSGWVVMGAENDFGEYEEFYTLCRKCSRSYMDLGA